MEKMDAFKGDKSVFIPKKTFKDKLSLGKGADQIDLYYFGRAHTNGDAWVVFKSLRVMHSGDAFAGKTTPIIDANNGGSAVDYGKTIAKAASSIKNVDTIITGHSPRMTPADLKEYAAFNNDFVDVGEGRDQGGQERRRRRGGVQGSRISSRDTPSARSSAASRTTSRWPTPSWGRNEASGSCWAR